MSEFYRLPEQRFHQAIIDNDIQTVKWLIQSKKIEDICNKNADDTNWSSLMLAARYGHYELFKYLLDIGHEKETTSSDSKGNTIPIISAKYRHEDMSLEYLARYPSTMSQVNCDGSSAINLAAQNGLNGVIQWILDNGGNANQRDIEGNTPLHHAASWNQFSTVTLLLERDAQPGLKNHKGYTAIEYAYSSAMDKHIRETVMRLQQKRQQIVQKQMNSIGSSATKPRASTDAHFSTVSPAN
ncbi:Target of rapamycin complex 2 subunit avo2 [Coemansia asiatica]|uniref:Target of rapamycin complex 2 subunit avo2 n=1 Tax=Coemansia asiatica TaxID=1052880 RepID=A0A9W7XD48_9FUNG|nr:Target of rapamycin complex 2 subunit avo2 [Coemansia asiatica]